jgi:hypothetical protein
LPLHSCLQHRVRNCHIATACCPPSGMCRYALLHDAMAHPRAAIDVNRCGMAGVLHSEATPQLADPQPEAQLEAAAAPQPPAAPSLIRQLQAPLGAGLLAGLLGDPPAAVHNHNTPQCARHGNAF